VSAPEFSWLEFAREGVERTRDVGRSPGAEAARMNARLAVELDPVRRGDRVADLRLGAAVCIAPRVEVAEALLLGASVPTSRLDPAWVTALDLDGVVVLDEALAVRIAAHGPLSRRKEVAR